MLEILDTLVQGALLGGLFALYALGLSLVFGVMRIVNIAHGDLIVLTAYFALVVCETFGIHPFLALVVVLPVAAVAGWLLQFSLFERVPRKEPLVPLLVAFGLTIIIQNVLLIEFGADPQKLNAGPIEQMSIEPLPGLHVGLFSLLIFATAAVLILGLQTLIYRTGFGRILRAVSDSETSAAMLGVDTKRVFRKAFALVMAIVAIAAILMAIKTNYDPASGPTRLLAAFEAVVIGGLGNLWGTFAGGIVIGVAQMIGAKIDASWQLLAGHIVFLVILVARPSGLFPKREG